MTEVIGSSEIGCRLPYHYPMLMLDRVCIESDSRAWAVKNLSVNEPFFVGHFPMDKIMPGVLQIEAMKQLGELLVQSRLNPGDGKHVYLKHLEKVKFRNPNRPGDRVKVEVELQSFADGEALLTGKTSNKQGVTCEAKLVLAAREREQVQSMPELWTEFDKDAGTVRTVEDIQKLLPHRYPFLLTDMAVKMDGAHVVAVKNLTCNEEIFQGGRPDYQVISEALLCEIVAQSGCICVLSRPDNVGKIGYFMSIESANFYHPVFAGDQLVCDLEVPDSKSRFGKGTGALLVDGKLVGDIKLMFAIVDPA